MRSKLTLALTVLFAGSVWAQVPDHRVQPPQISTPDRGSLAGQFARFALGPTDLTRGGASLPSPMSAPGDRGPLQVNPFPIYSPDGGVSEWGLGWQTTLSLVRTHIAGDIDYANDELTGPWGRMTLGTDGFWYPVGLQSLVRGQLAGDDFIAYLPDGTRWIFGGENRILTPRGTYAWHVREIQSITSRKTRFTYQRNDSGRLFLSSVSYGGFGDDPQYLITYEYESVPQQGPDSSPFIDYRSSEALVLDRRVRTVTVKSKLVQAGRYDERWHYTLGYQDDALGPAFYLTTILQTFASGETAPTVRYVYTSARDKLDSAQFRPVPKIDPLISLFGDDLFQPNRAALLDFDQDGRTDFEHHLRNTLLVQEDDRFRVEELGPRPADALDICRPAIELPTNPARALVQMRASDDSYQVVALHANPIRTQTDFTLCNREGQAISQQTLSDDWEPGPNIRLVDLNRDRQPDLIRVYQGGYAILPNISSAAGFAFGTAQTGILRPPPGDTIFVPSATWIHDLNGDGIPDIVSRAGSVLAVWFGRGNFQFTEQGQTFVFLTENGVPLGSLSSYQLTFIDVNKDGLTDLILSRGSGSFLFINKGTLFRETRFPAQDFFEPLTSRPVVADLVGSGDAEIMVTNRSHAYALSLEGPEVGLLREADDGKGTVLRFTYERSQAVPGCFKRQSVLARIDVSSSGSEPVSYTYQYSGPTNHSVGRFLVGFAAIARQSSILTETAQFLHGDFFAGLLLSSVQHDMSSPLVDAANSREYDDAVFQGLPWKRLKAEISGWRTPDGTQSIQERTDYLSYEVDFCPKQIRYNNSHGTLTTDKTRANPSGLSNHLHCLEQRVVLSGTHADASLDFGYTSELERNSVGLIEKVKSVGSGGPLIVQEIFYNPDFTIDHISSPGRGSASFGYGAGTLLLNRVTSPAGVVTQVTARDPITDAALTIDLTRGVRAYQQYFRYDGQERLAKKRDSLGAAGELNPDLLLAYRYATATQPASVFASALVDAATGAAVETFDLLTAKGEGVSTARHIPEGWAFAGLVTRDPGRLEQRRYQRPGVAPGTDVAALDYPALFGGAEQVALRHSSSLGHEVQADTRFHREVERRVATVLTLAGGRLNQTATENGILRVTSGVDAAQRLIQFEDEAQTRYGYRYDALGRLREVALPDGTKHQQSFDEHGRVSVVEREGIARIDYSYDATTGLVTRERVYSPDRELQRSIEWEYDAVGRKHVETYRDIPRSASQTFVYYYDGATPEDPGAQTDRGLLTAVVGNDYVKRLAYRADGSLTRHSLALMNWRTVVRELEYAESGAVRRETTRVTDGGGAPLSQSVRLHHWDAYGRESGFDLDGTALAGFSYDVNGEPSGVSFASGDWVSLEHDPLTRHLVGLSSAGRFASAYRWRLSPRGFVDYDSIGVGALNLTRSYGYSPPGFLTSSIDAQTSYAYEFDPFGLPTAIEENTNRRELARTRDVLTAGDVTYRFDALGRTIDRDDLHFTYAPTGHVARAERRAASWRYVYDENGERLLKLAGDTPVAAFVDGDYLDASGLTEPVRFAGVLVGAIQAGSFRLLATDPRGTVLADADGTPHLCSPFGDRAAHPDIFAALDYVQKSYDADLGVVRMGVRDYDPRINRFLTPDPLFLERPDKCLSSPVECNLYAYVRNNPLTSVDPEGQFTHILLGAGVGAAWGAGAYLAASLASGERPTLRGAAAAAAGGAVFGAIAAATGGVGTALAQGGHKIAAQVAGYAGAALAGGAGGSVTRVLSGQSVTSSTVVTDAAAGTLAKLLQNASRWSGSLATRSAESGGSALPNEAYRYAGEGETMAIRESGLVPNVTKSGDPKVVFLSPNEYQGVSEAEAALRVGRLNPNGATSPPAYRITVDTTNTRFTYAGNVEGGTGIEMTTRDALPAKTIEPLTRP